MLKTKVKIAVGDPTPIAYYDLFEEGDEWVKTTSCEGCPSIKKCCGNCPMLTSKGCFYHLENRQHSAKPFKCVVTPMPNIAISWCQLEYLCVKGTNMGKRRRAKDPRDVII
jgi:hypothetical protein